MTAHTLSNIPTQVENPVPLGHTLNYQFNVVLTGWSKGVSSWTLASVTELDYKAAESAKPLESSWQFSYLRTN